MTTDRSHITVAIPTYNSGNFIAETLNSVLGQTLRPERILLLDDASNDDTLERVRLWQLEHPEIDLVIHTTAENMGYQRNWNRALHLTKTEFLLILHADDRLKAEALSRGWSWLLQHPDHALVAGFGDTMDEQGNPLHVHQPVANQEWQRGKVYEFVIHTNSYLECSSVLMRLPLVQEVGDFRTDMHGTDEEFWPRILARHPIARLGISLIDRRLHANQAENRYWFDRNNLLQGFRNYSRIIAHEPRTELRPKLRAHLLRKFAGSSLWIAGELHKRYQNRRLSLWHLFLGVRFDPLLPLKKRSWWKVLFWNLIPGHPKPSAASASDRRVVTIFPPFRNVHIHKGPGQIGWGIARHQGGTSELWCYPEGDYPDLASSTPGQHLQSVENRWRFRWADLNLLREVFKQAPTIHLLVLIHYNLNTLLQAFVYKLRHPGGFVIMHLDFHPSAPGGLQRILPGGASLHRRLKRRLQIILSRFVNLCTIQDDRTRSLLETEFPMFSGRIITSFNGVDADAVQETAEMDDLWDRKSRILLTAGRLGTEAKATEVLLQAFLQYRQKYPEGWDLHLAGPVDPEFEPQLKQMQEQYRTLWSAVHFHGNITDRRQLYLLYSKASLFLLPSRWEGMAQVLPEAMIHGNAIIMTDVGGAAIATGDGEYGKIVSIDDPMALTQAIEVCTTDEEWRLKAMHRARLTAQEKLTWQRIIPELIHSMREHGYR